MQSPARSADPAIGKIDRVFGNRVGVFGVGLGVFALIIFHFVAGWKVYHLAMAAELGKVQA